MHRVLIVEDDLDISTTISEILLGEGYDVAVANNGLVGLDLVHGLRNEPRPDLVLLDLMMPELDGYAFLHAVRSDLHVCDIPVIVITAMTAHQARRKDLPASCILHKPIDLDSLLTVVHRALHPRVSSLPPPPLPSTMG